MFALSLAHYELQDLGDCILVAGPDGTTTLAGIEHLRFAERAVALAPATDFASYGVRQLVRLDVLTDRLDDADSLLSAHAALLHDPELSDEEVRGLRVARLALITHVNPLCAARWVPSGCGRRPTISTLSCKARQLSG